MFLNNKKRCFSLLLCLVMLFSLLPFSAFAADGEESHQHESSAEPASNEIVELTDTENVPAATMPENPAVQEFQSRIDDMMEYYLASAAVAEEAVQTLVAEMNDADCEEAYWEILYLDDDLMWAQEDGLVSESDLEWLYYANPAFIVFAHEVAVRAEATLPPFSFFTTITMLNDQLSLKDTQNTIKNSSGTVTATAKGSIIGKKTNTITITNDSGKTATLTFDYTVASASSFNIAGASAASSGNYSVLLNAGETLTIEITSNSGFSNLTVTLTMSNITLAEAAASSNVTFNYTSALGSVKVDNDAVSSGAIMEIPLDGAALVATPASGATFQGWVDGDNKILSTAANYTLEPAGDMTVKAVFGNASTGIFMVDEKYLIEGLSEACAKGTTIVLMNNYTLPSGDYTIPSGDTLLIPFDKENTLYTTAPGTDAVAKGGFLGGYNVATYVQPTAYRTLTMANGANITINGAISLSAKHHVASGGGRACGVPAGPCSFVNMEAGSTITVNNGGRLYAWGYITGAGEVTAESGATVYENFAIEDFMGGTTTSDLNGDGSSKHVFPFRAYYVQNILVPLTLKAGAYEKCYTSIHSGTMSTIVSTELPFVGPGDSIFTVESGSLTKKYESATDRCILNLSGTMKMNPVTMKVYISMDTANFDLPIPSNMTVNVLSGTTTINQSLVYLPGAQLYVAEGATFKISSGKRVIVYDSDQWGTYVFTEKLRPLTYMPNRKYTYAEKDLVDVSFHINGVLDASEGSLYTTAGGANIYSTSRGQVKMGAVTAATSYQYQSNANYVEHAIITAKLKNEDGSFVETTAATYNHDHFNANSNCSDGDSAKHGEWYKGIHDYKASSTTTAPTCTKKGYTTYTCSCGHSYVGDEQTALGHTEITDAAVDATCTTTGLTEGKHCSVCSEVIVKQEVVPVLGHKDGATDDNGYKDHKCDVCGETTSECSDKDGDSKCNTCGKQMYYYGWVSQVGLIEPWHLRLNVAIIDSTGSAQIDYDAITSYGFYYLRGSEEDTSVPSKDEIVADSENHVHIGWTNYDGVEPEMTSGAFDFFYADYDKGIYTYQMKDPIYAVFYFTDGDGTHYSTVVEYVLYDLIETRKSGKDGSVTFSEKETLVYQEMWDLANSISAYRTGKTDSYTKMGKKLSEVSMGAPAENSPYYYGTSDQIVLIEPWGMQLNTVVFDKPSPSSLAEHVNYSEFSEYGMVMYYDVDGAYEKLTAEEMLKIDGAYVFSSADSAAGEQASAFIWETGGYNGYYISARYNQGIYTYQLNSTLHMMIYLVKDGNYYYSSVASYNVNSLAEERGNNESFGSAEERLVYRDMCDLYTAITSYRDYYFSTQNQES